MSISGGGDDVDVLGFDGAARRSRGASRAAPARAPTSVPKRASSRRRGALPGRNPGTLTSCASLRNAASMAFSNSTAGTPTRRRTLLPSSGSTDVLSGDSTLEVAEAAMGRRSVPGPPRRPGIRTSGFPRPPGRSRAGDPGPGPAPRHGRRSGPTRRSGHYGRGVTNEPCRPHDQQDRLARGLGRRDRMQQLRDAHRRGHARAPSSTPRSTPA